MPGFLDNLYSNVLRGHSLDLASMTPFQDLQMFCLAAQKHEGTLPHLLPASLCLHRIRPDCGGHILLLVPGTDTEGGSLGGCGGII